MWYDVLQKKYPDLIIIDSEEIPNNYKGLYAHGIISIDKKLNYIEKGCILAEEIGHHFTTTGNIIGQKNISDRKQEHRARNWGYEALVPLDKIVESYSSGYRTYHETAEFLNVTEEYLEAAVDHYKSKHGIIFEHDGYFIFLGSSIEIFREDNNFYPYDYGC